jgi:hypothetical protein
MTFGLHSIVDFKGFEIMANMILGQIDWIKVVFY